MELDYSDETVTFSKVKTSQKNKTYEKGTDTGYTLVLNNQYISYGLDDTMFETYLTKISEYYTGFQLTPMSFTLAEPDFDLHVGDRVQVYDEEEQVTITGNVSKIVISGNCSMIVTCGGFENVSSTTNFTPTSYSQVQQAKGNGIAQKLHTKGTNCYAKTDGNGVQFGVGGDDGNEAPFAYLKGTASSGFELSAYGPYRLSVGGDGFSVSNAFHASMNVSDSGEVFLNIYSFGTNSRLKVDTGGKFYVHTDSIAFVDGNNTTYRFAATNDGWVINAVEGNDDIGRKLEAKSDGIYYNGKRLLTEEDLST